MTGLVRRLYREARAVEAEGGFGVVLDDRPVRTPIKATLVVPARALAEAIASEWAAQGEEVDPHAMPISRLANTAIDLTGPRRDEIVAELGGYARTDLLCYRAGHPPDLAARQQATWQPILDWAADTFGGRLEVTSGVVYVDQPAASVAACKAAVAALDDFALTALKSAVEAAGSLVLGLALVHGRLDAAAVFAASRLDEAYQVERWGEDGEAEKHARALAADLEDTGRFLAFLPGERGGGGMEGG